MSNPIKIIPPYRVKGIKNIEDYFVILNRLSKLIEEKKFRLDPEGFLVLVRWSNKKKCWVGDKCTSLSRDKLGISIDDLKFSSNLSKDYKYALNILLEKMLNVPDCINDYNLHKNELKTLAFKVKINYNDLKDVRINFIGLYFINRSKPCKILDTSNKTIINISKILNLQLNHILPDFKMKTNIFENFIKKNKNEIISLNVNNKEKDFCIKNIISSNQKISLNKISFDNKKYDHFNSKLFSDFIFNKKNIDESVFESILPNITIYYLNLLYFKYIKSTIEIENLNNPIIVYDSLNKKLYKISDNSYINNINVENKSDETNKEDSLKIDYKLMLPGLI